MRAGCPLGQVYRATAVRAVHGTDVLPEFGDLVRRQRTDEILFAEEVEKADQAPMPIRAIQVLESRRTLHVLRPPESAFATWTLRELGVAVLRPGQLLTDDAEERQRRSRRERRALARIEPETLTGVTDVDDHRPTEVTVEGLLLHRGTAARAFHGQHSLTFVAKQ